MRDDYGSLQLLQQHPCSLVQHSVFIQHSLSAAFFYQSDDRLASLLFQSLTQLVRRPRRIIFCFASTKMHTYTDLPIQNQKAQKQRWTTKEMDGCYQDRVMAENMRQFGQHTNEEVGEFCC